MRLRLALALALATVLVAWLFLSNHAELAKPPTGEGSASAAASSSFEAALPLAPASDVKPLSARAAVAVPAPAASTSFWELCGVGRMPVPANLAASAAVGLPGLPPNLGEQALVAARERILGALDAGEARSRAVAIILRGMTPPFDTQMPQLLSQLAATSNDPVVVGWAAGICEGQRDGCQVGLAQNWARLEPDNAAAWSHLLGREGQAPPHVMKALEQSRRFDSHSGAFMAVFLAAIPQDLPRYLQLELLLQARVTESGLAGPAIASLLRMCRTQPALASGSARQAWCSQMARTLMERGDTLLAYFIGLRVAEAAGMPASQAAALRHRMQSLLGNELRAVIDPLQPRSCASIDGIRSLMLSLAKDGEMKGLRERAASLPQR